VLRDKALRKLQFALTTEFMADSEKAPCNALRETSKFMSPETPLHHNRAKTMKPLIKINTSLVLLLFIVLSNCSPFHKRSYLADLHTCNKQTIISWRIKCYSQKINLDSTNADLYLSRAAAYTQSKIYTGARNDFLMAYGLGKNDPSVAQSIAFVYTRLGMADSAASWFFISGNPECCKQ